MVSEVSSVLLTAAVVTAAGCMTEASHGADALGATTQAEDQSIDNGDTTSAGGGGGYADPVVTVDDGGGTFISVGWLGGGHINRGTFDGLTIPQTLTTIDTHMSAHVVTRDEYCQTLAIIINNNWCRAGSYEQATMAAAWGMNCAPYGSGGGTCPP